MTLPAPRALRPPPYPPRRPGFWFSALHAWNGLVHTVEHQPNMRIHLLAALMVRLVRLGPTEAAGEPDAIEGGRPPQPVQALPATETGRRS